MLYQEIYPVLYKKRYMSPLFTKPLKGPKFLHWCREHQSCEYHNGQKGHNIEDCQAFKRKVQTLINQKVLSFDNTPEVSVSKNLLPKHHVGMIEFVICEEDKNDMVASIKPIMLRCNRNNKPVSTNQAPIIVWKPTNPTPTVNTPKIVLPTPKPFPFKYLSKVPWKYNASIIELTLKTMNVSGITSMTRRGRIFGPSKNPVIQVQDQPAVEMVSMKGKLN